MPGRPCAGDFLTAAAGHLARARQVQELPAGDKAMRATALEVRRVLEVLHRYLDDMAATSTLGEEDLRDMRGWPRAMLAARLAVEAACKFLPARTKTSAPAAVAVAELAAAARSLAAGRDLLQGHFAPGPQAGRVFRSEWAPLLTSPQGTRALGGEIAALASAAAAVLARLASSTLPSHKADRTRFLLQQACEQLWAAEQAVHTAHAADPVEAADVEMLHAVPLYALPAPARPAGTETVPALCEGITATAERIRQAAWQPDPAWSPGISAATMRHTAASAVVISHNCATALHGLAAWAHRAGLPDVAASIGDAASAAGAAQASWLDAARAWSTQLVTEPTGRLSQLCLEADDLAVWTGRLVYADPKWTPRRGRDAALRSSAELAQATGIGRVLAAVRGAGMALDCMAEHQAGQAQAVSGGRLYVPTRTLPESVDSPYRYGPAPAEAAAALQATYAAACHDGAALTAALAAAARSAGAPGPALAPALSRGAARPAPAPRPGPASSRPPARTSGPAEGLLVDLLRQHGVTRGDLLDRAAELQESAGLGEPGQPQPPQATGLPAAPPARLTPPAPDRGGRHSRCNPAAIAWPDTGRAAAAALPKRSSCPGRHHHRVGGRRAAAAAGREQGRRALRPLRPPGMPGQRRRRGLTQVHRA
jgi:hypothetical protein